MPMTGGCHCGAVRYRITTSPKLIYACHCTNCQRVTGSAFSMAVVFPAEALDIGSPELQGVSFKPDPAGARTSTRWICPTCGTWICGGAKPGTAPPAGLRAIRAGTLDDTSWVRPNVHFWTRSAQRWVRISPDATVFKTQPDNLSEWLSQHA